MVDNEQVVSVVGGTVCKWALAGDGSTLAGQRCLAAEAKEAVGGDEGAEKEGEDARGDLHDERWGGKEGEQAGRGRVGLVLVVEVRMRMEEERLWFGKRTRTGVAGGLVKVQDDVSGVTRRLSQESRFWGGKEAVF